MGRPAIRTVFLSCSVLALLAANAMAAEMAKVEDVVRHLDDLYRAPASSGHVIVNVCEIIFGIKSAHTDWVIAERKDCS
jgi:hypothetical protein